MGLSTNHRRYKMTKFELSKFARSVKLPRGWKVLHVYASDKGGKQVRESNDIYIGQPVVEYLGLSYATRKKLLAPVLRQLNKGKRKAQAMWKEWGGGFGGGHFYEIHLGINA